LKRALAPARLMISAHDFRGLPRDLSGVVKQIESCGADAIKIAATCHSLSEACRLFALTRRRSNVVSVPMGDEALAARILALREGSALAYASIARTTAPGQLSMDAMSRVYHLDRRFGSSTRGAPRGLNRQTRVYGVIGDPVGHSLSPLMHNAGLNTRRVNAIYVPFHVRELGVFISAVNCVGIAGFSVTIPHKQRILRYLHHCDRIAAEVGAVNTVVVRGGKLHGYNTDYVGVLKPLARRVALKSSRVLLIGAGGAARAAAFALAGAGAQVAIWARREPKARALARAAGGETMKRGALRTEHFDAIVNCTPVGMHPGGGSPLEPRELNCDVVMDLIYRPQKTELLGMAEQRGIQTISGLEMFLTQGMAQWELWFSQSAPEAAMRTAVLNALSEEEASSAGHR